VGQFCVFADNFIFFKEIQVFHIILQSKMSPNRRNLMSNVKFFLKELIVNDTETAFKTALFLVNYNQENKSLGSGTLDYNEIITQKGRYLTALQEYQQGLISRENRDITIQNCRLLILNWSDQLSPEFFNIPKEIESNLIPIETKKHIEIPSVIEVEKPEKIKKVAIPIQNDDTFLQENPLKSAKTLKEDAQIDESIRLEKEAKKTKENERKRRAQELEITRKNELQSTQNTKSEENGGGYILLKLLGGVIAFALFMTFCFFPILDFIASIFK
jgi:hypothetical protein